MKHEQDKYLEYLEGTLELLELALKNNTNDNKIVNLTQEDIQKNINETKKMIEEYKDSLKSLE